VEDQYRVARDATRVLLRVPERRVVDAQHRQRGAIGEAEVAHLEIALGTRC
jgi:uncharacterized membrane protein